MKIRDLPIKQKLSLSTVIASSAGLLIACSAFIVFDQNRLREQLVAHTSSLARLFAFSSAAALEFRDAAGASEILAALSLKPRIRTARLFSADGVLVAEYLRDPARDATIRGQLYAEGARFDSGALHVVAPVRMAKERIGYLYLESDLQELRTALIRDLVGSGGLLLACALIASTLGMQLQRAFIRPILDLSETARWVSEHKDYSVRSTKYADDETGSLVDDFNEMLSIIERDADLEEQRQQLLAEVEQRKRLNEQLKVEMERAEAAALAKTQFLANMSHEIRTPMTAILGFSDMLLDDRQSPEERLSHIETIRRNGEHLLTIINDILDLSKVEAGELSVDHVPCSPTEVVSKVATLIDPLAREKGLELEVEFTPPIPGTIRSDPTRLQQILTNLAQNAVKFTDEGSVRIVCSMDESSEGRELSLRFDVADTGVGIPGEAQRRIFEPFGQADLSTTRQYAGTGLGLAIAQKLSVLLHGSLSVASTPGHGSTFTLRIPTGPIDESVIRDSLPGSSGNATLAVPSLPRARVLLVEDGRDNQRLIGRLLRKAGLEVELADNGEVAVAKVSSACEVEEPFDLILMDMQMPVKDGYEATRELRAAGCTIPIIAVTAHALSGDRERCRQAGCDDYLTKPLDRDRFLALVGTYLAKSTRGSIPS